MSHYRYEVAYITDPGNRRSENQDSLVIKRGSFNRQEFLLLAVADGMGGTTQGGLASHVAAEQLSIWWDSQLPAFLGEEMDLTLISGSLQIRLEAINDAIRQARSGCGDRSGTTLSLLFIYGGRYLMLHVGDSRIYLVQQRRAQQISHDQTWCQREVDLGHITAAQANTHPKRHMLVSALGMGDAFDVEEGKGIIAAGDSFLLCSDGFYNELDIDAFCQRLRRLTSPQKSLDQAYATIKKGVAEDNLTAVFTNISSRWGH